MANLEKYQGSCHCGDVKFEVDLDLSGGVISCNCSMCGRAGALLTFAPPTQFTLLAGDDATRDYQFNKHVIHHLFCTKCGIKSYSWGTDKQGNKQYAINVRCLDGVDPDSLKINKWDGKNH
ncbi:MAG: GFA family protein [Polyangiaceae bacterium]